MTRLPAPLLTTSYTQSSQIEVYGGITRLSSISTTMETVNQCCNIFILQDHINPVRLCSNQTRNLLEPTNLNSQQLKTRSSLLPPSSPSSLSFPRVLAASVQHCAYYCHLLLLYTAGPSDRKCARDQNANKFKFEMCVLHEFMSNKFTSTIIALYLTRWVKQNVKKLWDAPNLSFMFVLDTTYSISTLTHRSLSSTPPMPPSLASTSHVHVCLDNFVSCSIFKRCPPQPQSLHNPRAPPPCRSYTHCLRHGLFPCKGSVIGHDCPISRFVGTMLNGAVFFFLYYSPCLQALHSTPSSLTDFLTCIPTGLLVLVFVKYFIFNLSPST